MSEAKTGKRFEMAITILEGEFPADSQSEKENWDKRIRLMQKMSTRKRREVARDAIRVLREWPRWEKLIEVAGKGEQATESGLRCGQIFMNVYAQRMVAYGFPRTTMSMTSFAPYSKVSQARINNVD